ncbi:MAG: hypothetical protein JWM37_132 [Candidatus Saccharibacteria bacterium]|nr:hypothetical protein [Candidatus Saccharibacteria bacterium]
MKQKDIATIAIIAVVSGVLSFLISNKIFVTPSNRQQNVEQVDVITADFQAPSEKYFNSSSVNPAQSVQIGDSNNISPFGSDQ